MHVLLELILSIVAFFIIMMAISWIVDVVPERCAWIAEIATWIFYAVVIFVLALYALVGKWWAISGLMLFVVSSLYDLYERRNDLRQWLTHRLSLEEHLGVSDVGQSGQDDTRL